VVVDGLTAANDLGLTDAVPARIGVLTDGRLRPITLGNLTLDFQAAVSHARFRNALHCICLTRSSPKAGDSPMGAASISIPRFAKKEEKRHAKGIGGPSFARMKLLS
jgi:hypothetical protein